MSRRVAALRLALAVAAISAIAACAAPTAPSTSGLKAPPVSRDGFDTTCRSGYSTSQGNHC
jgi:hypothetical protein